jgi:hypothetical protein
MQIAQRTARLGAVNPSLKALFSVGSPEQALAPDVPVPDDLAPLGQGGAAAGMVTGNTIGRITP